MNENHEMLDLLKALTDADRLRIIGVLAKCRANAEEIASRLHLPFRGVFNHLAFLSYVGIVSQADNLYELKTEKLDELARQQFGKERPGYVPAPDMDEKARKVLATYLNPDGGIKQIPLQPAKLRVILAYILQTFSPGTQYTEKEVNMILARFNEDISGLRRDLVDAGLLARERDGSRYWRVDRTEQEKAGDA